MMAPVPRSRAPQRLDAIAAAALATFAAAGYRGTRMADVADAASVRALAATVDRELGGADLLCNNAGVFAGGTIWSEAIADYEWVLGVNFYGILHGIQAFVPGMLERGRHGHVVNTVSAAGLFPSAFSAPYTVSKFAAFAVTECLAAASSPAGFRSCPTSTDARRRTPRPGRAGGRRAATSPAARRR